MIYRIMIYKTVYKVWKIHCYIKCIHICAHMKREGEDLVHGIRIWETLCPQTQVPLLMIKFHCGLNAESKAFIQ